MDFFRSTFVECIQPIASIGLPVEELLLHPPWRSASVENGKFNWTHGTESRVEVGAIASRDLPRSRRTAKPYAAIRLPQSNVRFFRLTIPSHLPRVPVSAISGDDLSLPHEDATGILCNYATRRVRKRRLHCYGTVSGGSPRFPGFGMEGGIASNVTVPESVCSSAVAGSAQLYGGPESRSDLRLWLCSFCCVINRVIADIDCQEHLSRGIVLSYLPDPTAKPTQHQSHDGHRLTRRRQSVGL
jgi:hypothetical protein